MSDYTKYFNARETPQNQEIPGKRQVKNSAGGYVFETDAMQRLKRFLILGSESPTYYVGQQKLTVDNAKNVMDCVKNNGLDTVNMIVEISEAGRAPKNDPALFALALAIAYGDLETRKAAYDALPKVARIPTHLFSFLEYLKAFKGWSRGLRRAVSNWYLNNDKLPYHTVKYRQRNGWSHLDVLRMAHVKPETETQKELFYWIANGWESVGKDPHPNNDLQVVWAYEKAKRTESEDEIVNLITDYNLPREAIDTKWFSRVRVWDALLQKMPLTAMIRNLGKMSEVGLLGPFSDNVNLIVERLQNQEYLTKSRIHPLNVLVAMKVYAQGKAERGDLTWNPVSRIVDALDDAFYLSFGNVIPTGKRIMLALDVSGSMTASINGLPLSCREASAAMALIAAKTEQNYMFTIFSSAGKGFMKSNSNRFYGDNGIGYMPISPRQRLDDVVNQITGLPFGGTDCALPMLYALENKIQLDAFVIYTDNETWAGGIHPSQALEKYRKESGIDAKLITVGMTSAGFSIADPARNDMLDVVGFDTATPNIISEFIS